MKDEVNRPFYLRRRHLLMVALEFEKGGTWIAGEMKRSENQLIYDFAG